jgi:hypothetical protein
MQFKKIAGPIQIFAGAAGAAVPFPLQPTGGGRSCKVVQYMVKVVATTGAPTLNFVIDHGPDGIAHLQHTAGPGAAAPPASRLYQFDSNAAVMLCEYLHPIPWVGGAAATDSMTVEVYEMRKPF